MLHSRVNEPSEHASQAAVIEWVQWDKKQWPVLALLYAVPNAAKRSFAAASWMRAEGLHKGVWDLHLPVSRGGYIGLWIEMKRRGEKLDHDQQIWGEAMRANGHMTVVCFSSDEARDALIHYVKLRTLKEIALGKPGVDREE